MPQSHITFPSGAITLEGRSTPPMAPAPSQGSSYATHIPCTAAIWRATW